MITTAVEQGHNEPQRANNSVFRDYLQLTKPRIVVLLIFTTVTAMVIAAQGIPLPPFILLATILGGSFSAAGANVMNQYIDRDMDLQMSRTKNRPISRAKSIWSIWRAAKACR